MMAASRRLVKSRVVGGRRLPAGKLVGDERLDVLAGKLAGEERMAVGLAVGGERPDGVGVGLDGAGLLFSASNVRRKLRLRARRCPRGDGAPTGAGCSSGTVPHIRVSWSGWLSAACSG